MKIIGTRATRLTVVLATALAISVPSITLGFAENNQDNSTSVSQSLVGNYLAARVAATDKDTQSAANFYRKAIALDPENNNLKLKAFLAFVGNGDFVEGVEIGEHLTKLGNEPEIVSLVLAVEDIRKKSWASAERKLSKDWRSAVDRLMAGLVLGWVNAGNNKVDEGLKLIDGLKGPAWFDLFVQYHGGLIALTGGKTKEAIKRLEAAHANRAGGQAANDTYMRVVSALVQAHFKDGNVKKAQEVLTDGLGRAIQNPIFEKMQADLDANKPLLVSVTNPQRGAAEVFLNLGTAINREGGEEFARIYMQLANNLAPKEDAVTSQLAGLFDAQGMLERANVLFDRIEPTSPYFRLASLEKALNLDELEKRDEAKAELEELIASGPDDLIAHLSFGAVLARHEDFAGAIVVYNKIIGRIAKPERVHWNLFYRLGIAYERTKQWPLAEAAFRKSLELVPDQPSVLNYLGYSWVDMNINLQEGLDMIRKAVSLRPNDGYMVDSLGWAYFKLGRVEEAVVELERAVELRPGDPTINDHLGDAYWKAKRKLEATFQWRHALALDPPKGDSARIDEKLDKGLDEVEKREIAEKKNPDKG